MLEKIEAKLNMVVWIFNIGFAVFLIVSCMWLGNPEERGYFMMGILGGVIIGYFTGAFFMFRELATDNVRDPEKSTIGHCGERHSVSISNVVPEEVKRRETPDIKGRQ